MNIDLPEIDQKKVSEIKKKAIKEINADPALSTFIKNNNISEFEVYEHISDFYNVLLDRNICKNCQGLSKCKKKGYELDLVLDEHRMYCKTKQCKYLQNRSKYASKFLICDVDINSFNYDLQDALATSRKERKDVITTMALMIKNDNYSDGIYLYGNEHVGKSFVMQVFAKTIASKKEDYLCYVNFKNMIPDMLEESRNNPDSFASNLDLLKTIPFLFIDSFGEEEKNDYSKINITLEIIKARSEKNLPTFITSRYSPRELIDAYKTPKTGTMYAKELSNIIINKYQIKSMFGIKIPF